MHPNWATTRIVSITIRVFVLRSTKIVRSLILLAIIYAVAPYYLAASAALTGTLRDPQGRFISGANVSLLRRADLSRRAIESDEQGQYSFGAIDAGEYRLTVESSGFPIITRTIQVTDGVAQVENVQFSAVASQNQSVNVSADVSDVGLRARPGAAHHDSRTTPGYSRIWDPVS